MKLISHDQNSDTFIVCANSNLHLVTHVWTVIKFITKFYSSKFHVFDQFHTVSTSYFLSQLLNPSLHKSYNLKIFSRIKLKSHCWKRKTEQCKNVNLVCKIGNFIRITQPLLCSGHAKYITGTLNASRSNPWLSSMANMKKKFINLSSL